MRLVVCCLSAVLPLTGAPGLDLCDLCWQTPPTEYGGSHEQEKFQDNTGNQQLSYFRVFRLLCTLEFLSNSQGWPRSTQKCIASLHTEVHWRPEVGIVLLCSKML